MYDCIIIGASVAGISAAINLKIRKKEFLLIGSKEFSAKVQKAELIQNYVGMPSLSSFGITDMQVVWRDAGKANLVTEQREVVVT